MSVFRDVPPYTNSSLLGMIIGGTIESLLRTTSRMSVDLSDTFSGCGCCERTGLPRGSSTP